MAIRFQVARLPAGKSPNVQSYPIDSAASFTRGAVLALDAQGEVTEHAGGATVTGILGVALQGTSAAGTPDFGDEIQVAIADRNQIFMGQLINAGTIQTASDATIGDTYGVIEVSDEWYVDEADTTNVVVEIVDTDDDLNVVFFKFIESALAQP